MLKPILIGISPNTEADDVWLAVKLLFQPWRWLRGRAEAKLAAAIKKLLPYKYCYLVNAGRTALYLAIKSLNLKPGDEVIHLEFTCAVVPEAIVRAGGQPVGVKNLETAKISANTKAMICQHTFGFPDRMEAIAALCLKHKLVLIEDLAHSLGATFKGKPVGSFGQMAMLSFGRDKIISSVFGGALLANKALDIEKIDYPSRSWILRQLLHPVLMALCVPTYFFGGKVLIYLARKFGIISLPLDGLKVQKLPNSLAELAFHQWQKLEKFNAHRRRLARFYAESFDQPFNSEAVYLRYPLAVSDPRGLIRAAKKNRLLLGNWYDYRIVNLPTHIRINLADARRVVNFVKNYVKNPAA